MFTALMLSDFKSFAHAELSFGPITTIIGANATGKSNLRDALKFLHAVGRGLTLPEIFGGKSSVGWPGIRGGVPGTVRDGQKRFSLQLSTNRGLKYRIEIAVGTKGPTVRQESLFDDAEMLFETQLSEQEDAKVLDIRVVAGGNYRKHPQKGTLPAHQPMLSQVTELVSRRDDWHAASLIRRVSALCTELAAIRFIDFSPVAMRQPSVPGEKTISESGDNLSSVLRYLVEDQNKEAVLASWIKALTPMDVTSIGFEEYPDGKILAVLHEQGGRKVPLSSASDGTLRFLGILASVLSPEAPSLLCFEELETGLHPVRVQLVAELLQKHTAGGRPQVLLTTHSPALIGCLGQEHRDHAYLTYRLQESADTQLKAFRDIPTLQTALEKADASRLFETGWFEDAMFFAEGQPTPISFVAEDGPENQS